MASKHIPIIDISALVSQESDPARLERVSAEIRAACEEIGFFYVSGHGIRRHHMRDVFGAIERFFALPEEEKMRIHMAKSTVFRGFTPQGLELTNDKKDWHEAVDFGLDLPDDHPDVIAGMPLQGPNQWPINPPDFRPLLAKHWSLILKMGEKITEGLALSLDLPRDYFHRYTRKMHSSMRILHYPPFDLNEPTDRNQGIGAHVDYGFVTILAQDAAGGLEVRNTNGWWVPATHIPDTFVINLGLMMQRWTNDRYKATEHRAIARENAHRYSLPFFYEPDFDTIVTPLSTCCSDSNPPKYAPFHFGQYLLEKYGASYAKSVK